jgi:calcineurin-like phosphoesterase family protein
MGNQMKTFLYADPHFTHHNILKFTMPDGERFRLFDSIEEMDDTMVNRINEVVGEDDTLYMLGDIALNRGGLAHLARINCKNMILIKGNHDVFKLEEYTPYFKDIRSSHVINGMILSHIPIHPDSLGRYGCNIHGHLHWRSVTKDGEDGNRVVDPRYFCVSVEQNDYYPFELGDLQKRIVDQGGYAGLREYHPDLFKNA